MVRKIVEINEEKCNGCGACAEACHEGAIAMINGKAKLVRDDYCDGLGDCLPECPVDAIRIIKREAADYDAAAVAENMKMRRENAGSGCHGDAGHHDHGHSCPGSAPRTVAAPHGCPGSAPRTVEAPHGCPGSAPKTVSAGASEGSSSQAPRAQSQLRQWPVQIQLAPVKADFFENAKLLIAADCTPFAYANFHEDFIKGHVVLVGCPKLDPVNYAEKLTAIIRENNIRSVSLVRMEVPCCGGLQMAAMTAMQQSGKFLPWSVTTISLDGRIIDEM